MKESDIVFAFAAIAEDVRRAVENGHRAVARMYHEQLAGARRCMTFCGVSVEVTERADRLWSALNEVV